MLATNLKTLVKGIEIVKAHKYTRDSQQVFADLVALYTTSITASTRAQVLFEKITVNTIPETRLESLEKSITTFNDWLCEYNLISPDKMNDDSRLVHFKHYTENVPELENTTSEISIIRKALKTPISASNQLDVYKGRAALADQKSNKVTAMSRRRAFATESHYEAFKTEGAYEVFR